MAHNPGSYIKFEYDDHTHCFTRYFISFKACIDGFNHCHPLLFLDATFQKGRFKGFLLAATTKDGNQGLFPLAYVVMDSENTSNWSCNANRFPKRGTHFLSSTFAKEPEGQAMGNHYKEMCSNAAESFNSWIREPRNLSITRMVDSIKTKLMRQMAKRRVTSHTWTDAICSKMESRLDTTFNKGRSWNVSQANADIYEVHSFSSVTINVGRRTCSCFQWQLKGFPCAHVVVAVQNSGRNLNELVEPYFHVSKYRSTYAPTIYPIPTVEYPLFSPNDYFIQPPVVKCPPSRPKKKRIPSKGEHVQQIHCGRCSRMGNHNKKTCNTPI
ncbi:hypothetical protein ACSBR2_039510 [Camellia fascicularis]